MGLHCLLSFIGSSNCWNFCDTEDSDCPAYFHSLVRCFLVDYIVCAKTGIILQKNNRKSATKIVPFIKMTLKLGIVFSHFK